MWLGLECEIIIDEMKRWLKMRNNAFKCFKCLTIVNAFKCLTCPLRSALMPLLSPSLICCESFKSFEITGFPFANVHNTQLLSDNKTFWKSPNFCLLASLGNGSCIRPLPWWGLFSCPKQLNRWPCHSLTHWLTHSLTQGTFTFDTHKEWY